MTREPVTISIPVGPAESHRRWVGEAMASAADQCQPDDEILLVVDGGEPYDKPDVTSPCEVNVFQVPWNVWVASAFNIGVGAGHHDLNLMLGSDDTLMPDAIDACVQTWEDNDRADAYYWMSIEYSDDRKDRIQALPCNAAMVTRAFWRWSGGFPPETASGAPDAALISMLLVHAPERLIAVQQGTPLTWVRVHEGQDTAGRAPWQDVILRTRDILTKRGFEHGSTPPGA